jgi:hypothetical protein
MSYCRANSWHESQVGHNHKDADGRLRADYIHVSVTSTGQEPRINHKQKINPFTDYIHGCFTHVQLAGIYIDRKARRVGGLIDRVMKRRNALITALSRASE